MIEFTSGGILGLEFSLSENFKWQIQFFNNSKDICLLPQWRLLQLLTFNTPWKEFRVESEALLPQGNWWNRSLDQFSSVPLSDWLTVSQSPVWLCDPIDCSTPGLPIHHQVPELAQTHVHWVGDAIQPSHPLSSPSPPVFNLSQHQGLFQWVSSLHQVAKVLEFQLQHQSFQWTFRTDFF